MTPGQTSFLRDTIEKIDWFPIQFDNKNLFGILNKITDEQRRYFHFLILNKKHMKLRNMLIQIGVKPKKYE